MQLLIEQSDFRRLSSATQTELLESLAGRPLAAPAAPAKKPITILWRKPMDLSPDLAVRLLHGLSDAHKARLRLFAEKGGRVTQKQLLGLTKDTDMRVLSHFQAVLSRRLRRFVDDPEKKAHLIGWDFDSTKWDATQSQIVDGVYYVTDATTRSLQDYFRIRAKQRARAG